MSEQERLVIKSAGVPQPFNYAVGMHGSKFLQGLKEKKFLGIKCPQCQKVYLPPRRVCGPCYKEMTEFVEVSSKGVIHTFTILRYGFIDPETGVQKPVPYCYGFVTLDGADTLFQSYIDISEEEKIQIGARVEAVFVDNPKGAMTDVKHFRLLE